METWQAKVIAMVSMFAIAFLPGIASIKLFDFLTKRRHLHDRPSVTAACDRASSEEHGPPIEGESVPASVSNRLSTSFSSSKQDQVTSNQSGNYAIDVTNTADWLLSLLNCCAGGVFLATSLLHLLPDVRKDVAKVFGSTNQDFPIAEFITSVGFFFVLAIEQAVTQFRRYRSQIAKRHRQSLLSVVQELRSAKTPQHLPVVSQTNSTSTSTVAAKSSILEARNSGSHNDFDTDRSRLIRSPKNDTMDDRRGMVYGSISSIAATSAEDKQQCRNPDEHSTLQIAVVSRTDVVDEPVHSTRSFILLLALSIHTVFEGLAIGLQVNAAGLWTLFTAVALHKSIMAFTSGLRFAVSLPTLHWATFYIFFFALTSPIGIAIGTAVSETGSGGMSANIASAVLQGLATGTFIYVTFFEVLNEQLGHVGSDDEKPNGSGMINVLAAIIGYSFVTILELVTDG